MAVKKVENTVYFKLINMECSRFGVQLHEKSKGKDGKSEGSYRVSDWVESIHLINIMNFQVTDIVLDTGEIVNE